MIQNLEISNLAQEKGGSAHLPIALPVALKRQGVEDGLGSPAAVKTMTMTISVEAA